MPKELKKEENENIPQKIKTIHDMPDEILLIIFSFVPTSSLTSVGRTCQRWLDILSSKWFLDNYWPRVVPVGRWSVGAEVESPALDVCLS